ncbi:hypothetical protein TWF569_008110 [Orbilia oligospora]|uniref:Ammonium transporter n=1 Tax=Orbilia oligospora TaxID=2813651 RepID=A0A7C8JFU2_ORBOL|nr:hypothetical protein TWF706_009111 [Orbilia oligospora]KAF3100277.1 hypothetical protein TWF103_008297 [Orbilia oligospora]KAF3112676.1 hypothetical protein TWF102_004077 [Orbilia oligospora]KAF3120905.1 hypothetical protein TWF703_002279 [Orbilia oligospora]KAF3123264.1 hypothetical protein TWF594_002483 [Orbilia oligospora]
MSAEEPIDLSVYGLDGGDSGNVTIAAAMNDQYNRGDLAWVLTAAVLVWLMIPGVGLLYAGLSRRHASAAQLWQGLVAVGIVTFQWFFWGYSLTFSHSANDFIGDLKNFGSMHVLGAPSVGSSLVPDILFYFFQLVFACVTGVIMLGGAVERGRLMPSMVFLFIWTTIVYDPIACWTWNGAGWLFKLGSLDFAGGGPVHMSSGAGALAYALMVGRRTGDHGGKMPHYKPGNVFFVALGTIFLWFGWFGFNGGSAVNMSLRSIYAAVNTNLAASCGALTFCIIDYFRKGQKWSIVSLCSGAIAGLVGITPACGYVPIYTAVPIGVLAAAACNFAFDLKHILKIDDGLDVFALHGVGGFVGNVLTGIFAADYIAALDGATEIPGGWLNQNYIQLGYQLAGCVAILAYAFTVTCLILFVVDKIPGLDLRLPSEFEDKGIDHYDMGEMLLEYGLMEVLEAGVEAKRASKVPPEAMAPSSDGDDAAQVEAKP